MVFAHRFAAMLCAAGSFSFSAIATLLYSMRTEPLLSVRTDAILIYMETAWQVALNPIYRGTKPIRCEPYKRYIKRFACIACGSARNVDPAHTGSHGMSQKSSDMSVLPLCRVCHQEFDADPRGFAVQHNLDIPELIAFHNHLWKLKMDRRAV